MRIKVSRVLTFDYEVQMTSYPGMTPEEAAAFEREMPLSDIAELLEYQDIKSFVIAEVETDNG